MKKLHKDKPGFTIIEVMIVLAIAGIIMLIIFLAVPALQRSVRNQRRRNDAATISAAVINYIANHQGQYPNRLQSDALSNDSFDMLNSSNVNVFDVVKLSYYDPSSDPAPPGSDAGPDTTGYGVIISDGPVTQVKQVNIIPLTDNKTDIYHINIESVSIIEGESCDDTNPGTGLGILNSRAVAVFYVVEDGGNGTLQCYNAA